MATVISLSALLTIVRDGQQILRLNPTDSFTATGQESNQTVQSVGTSAEALVLGEVSTIGYTLVMNLDATNYVEIDNEAGMAGWPQKLLAGDFILLKPQAATIYGKANTAACNVLVAAVEL